MISFQLVSGSEALWISIFIFSLLNHFTLSDDQFVAQRYNLVVRFQNASSCILIRMKVQALQKLVFYATCGLWAPFRERPVEIPEQQWLRPSPTCKCGKVEPVHEFADVLQPIFNRVCIGYITWVPCPIHPCQHSPSEDVKAAMKDTNSNVPETEHTERAESIFKQKCLCSKQAQIELHPKIKEQQDYWFAKRPI